MSPSLSRGTLVLFAALALTGCPTSEPCGPTTCPAGCCDALGVCQSGILDNVCGTHGAFCADCAAAGRACLGQACYAPGTPIDSGSRDSGVRDAGATDSGVTDAGGLDSGAADSGTGDAGAVDSGMLDAGPTCTTIAVFTPANQGAAYLDTGTFAPPNDVTYGLLQDASGQDLEVDLWYGSTAGGTFSFPLQRSYSSATHLKTCDVCTVISQGCTASGCARTFLAVGGTVSVSQASKDPVQGRIVGSGAALHFLQWQADATHDQPLDGGACIDVGSFALDLSWSFDSGTPDAGSDGGADAGGSDGGVPVLGLVAFYPFDGDATDQSGHGANGTVYGATLTSDRFGQPSHAYNFDAGASPYIDCGTNLSLPLGATPRTLSLWLRGQSVNVGYQSLANWGTSSTDQRFGISTVYSTATQQNAMFTAQYDDIRSAAGVTDGGWHHLLATYDGASVVLYVDGAPVGTLNAALSTTGQNLLIGQKAGRYGEFVTGDLDDVRVYDRALLGAEIQALFHEGGW